MKYQEAYPNSQTTGESGIIYSGFSVMGDEWGTAYTSSQLEKMFIPFSYNRILNYLYQTPDFATYLFERYSNKWKKLWKDFNLEYNPLDAYTMNESETKSRELSRSDDLTHGKTTTQTTTDKGTISIDDDSTVTKTTGDTTTHTGTDSTVETGNQTEDNSVYGFNSTADVNSSKTVTATNNTSTVTHDTTDSSEGSDTTKETRETTDTHNLTKTRNESDSGTDKRAITDDESETRSLKKNGNIGYSTPQTLLRDDIDLWAMPYFNIVFQDIANEIFVQIFV